jgi:hyaluronan synthase
MQHKILRLGFFGTIVLLYCFYLFYKPLRIEYIKNNPPLIIGAADFENQILISLSSAERTFLLRCYKINTSKNAYSLLPINNSKEKSALIQIYSKSEFYASKIQNSYEIYFYIFLICIFFLRFFVALFFKSKKTKLSSYPELSILIPVKNEEKFIFETIYKANNTGYPKEKIKLIVIDDGSDDATWNEILRAKKIFNNLVTDRNPIACGKLKTLLRCAENAPGEFYLLLDSDTLLEKNSIENAIAHFTSSEIGIVAGHTQVTNEKDNLLTRIQGYQYFIAHRLTKSFESAFGLVTCAPGCFSVYRASLFNKHKLNWSEKKFLGKNCVSGEDRALTNLILKNHPVVYADNAKAKTLVPNKLSIYLTQQKRWMRSWFRESLYASLFMWKKNPLLSISFYLAFFASFFAPITFLRELVLLPALNSNFPFAYLTIIGTIILGQSLFCSILGEWKHAGYGIVFSLFYLLVIIWIIPFAVFTVLSDNWGSRNADTILATE